MSRWKAGSDDSAIGDFWSLKEADRADRIAVVLDLAPSWLYEEARLDRLEGSWSGVRASRTMLWVRRR